MCYRPIKLFNNTNSLKASDSTRFLAPCGECEECRTIRACEYTFRIYNEMETRAKQGYKLFFGTLTYNDDCLPKSAIVNKYNKSTVIKCFRRSDVETFFKSIRKHLLQKYGITDISYVCASEYGSYTQRSHYHFYLGVPKTGILKHVSSEEKKKGLKLGDTVEMTSELIHSLVLKYWTFGFVFPRYHTGGIDHNGYEHKPFEIDTENIKAAAFYIAKYCCKDLVFLGLPEVKVYLDICHSYIHSKLDDSIKLQYKRKIREHMTFVLTSRHFGEHINDLVKSVDDLINGVNTTMNDKKLIPVPEYNKRKLIYKVRTVKEDPSIKILKSSSTKLVYKDQDETFESFLSKLDPKYKIGSSFQFKTVNVYQYKVRYDLTPLGKQYFKKFIKNRISSTVDAIKEFISTDIFSKDFEIWYRQNYSQFDYNFDGTKSLIQDASVFGFRDYYSKIYSNPFMVKALATYLNVYYCRCSPLHLQFYLNDKGFFDYGRYKSYTIKNMYDGKLVTENCSGYVVEGQRFKTLSSISKNKKLSWTSASTDTFLGTESLKEMVDKAFSFYVSNLDVDRYVDEGKVSVKDIANNNLVHFNAFPCFSGFDSFIKVFKEYRMYSNNSVYETRAERNRQISHYKQALTEVDY